MYMEDAFMARVMNGLNLNKFSMILPSITENETNKQRFWKNKIAQLIFYIIKYCIMLSDGMITHLEPDILECEVK